ncbi:peptidoglycan-binding domain-containing protein [Kitasatospora sp. CM 4170]|uniref:Peptidoglycan-binding domain-containing protein n=1 Tax=Kitasatospora aburaviensis TaxID=67265 RepID=A0ABW1FCK2_9ACTN|nr:peptidoglycan-binding domain-containing protein [Kitasatospora sp. CM 4170]WNM49373.1 peptidoglycan-binding domain-containing protein [Kitasatospora sp. CM 4170]
MRVMKRTAAVALSAALLAGAGVLAATNASAATVYGCQRYQSYQSAGGYSGYFASYGHYDGNTTVPVGGAFSYAALEAQCALRSLGYGVTADGYYGPKTQSAVAGFQSAHGLSPDGFVGPSTWPALRYYAADQRAGCGVVAAGAAPKASVAAVPMGC